MHVWETIGSDYLASRVKVAVLVKGGHLVNDATYLLYEDGQAHWFTSSRIDTTNTHGTGPMEHTYCVTRA